MELMSKSKTMLGQRRDLSLPYSGSIDWDIMTTLGIKLWSNVALFSDNIHTPALPTDYQYTLIRNT